MSTVYIAFLICWFYATYAAEILNQMYTSDVTLRPFTEYIINQDIVVEQGVTFHIPNNTNISFEGNHKLTIRGNLIIGCQDVDAANNRSVGIIDPNLLIFVYANESLSRNGMISIEQTGNATICNTKFTNLDRAISLDSTLGSSNEFILDNCEFEHCNYGLFDDAYPGRIGRQITDNIFYNLSYGIYGIRGGLIENNLFLDMHYKAIYCDCCGYNYYSGVEIINNSFVNDTDLYGYGYGYSYAITSNTNANITSNTFVNFSTAIRLNQERTKVEYNEFIDNDIAISIQTSQTQRIHFNNFISNGYNIELQANENQEMCDHNFHGVVGDGTSPQLTGDKILDFCDSNGFSGLITFWPYFEQELSLNDMNNVPALYTFDFIDCTSINTQSGTLVPGLPTTSIPSSTPSYPTTYPSMAPTRTRYPTTAPSTNQTTNITNNPTITPTDKPTQAPTDNSTNYPTITPTDNPTETTSIETSTMSSVSSTELKPINVSTLTASTASTASTEYTSTESPVTEPTQIPTPSLFGNNALSLNYVYSLLVTSAAIIMIFVQQ